ncbi:MAG: 50S ribosomal protein L22 [Candidatus Gottesmanbacteria bacterium GW2011_GWA2_41_12]|uniref:Large ribosomal subunit protein uL22 n=2 Tax=Candidatus Gottesmaniibacteriota TaxID=1752720 RepID=A0A0G0UI60_9BACT|nr:MAG: 50S ribosomal protein L22 [Candidatus Gottesmanbacteria bacterium GW2011_GWC2_39_8]KKR88514.1 MAG: 50S ribosomal protein L22 [Candidatus Gottesmanbacteria bacterium GW2011_GWA2_41_12]
MEITAEAKYLRLSPKKAKFLAEAVRKLSPKEACEALEFKVKSGSEELIKLIKGAMANGKNNFKLDDNNLYIKSIEVLKGPVFKRWQPVSRGMAHSIKKRTSHIRIVLAENQKSKIKNQKLSIKTEKEENGTKS